MSRAPRNGFLPEFWSALRAPVPPAQQGYLAFGWIFLLLLLVEGGTGVLLSIYYQPVPAMASESLTFVMRDVDWGWLVRGLHLWAGYGLTAIALLHVLRMLLMGTYRGERAAHWVLGVLFLLMIVVFGASGELLTWDAEGYWAAAGWAGTLETIPGIGPALASMLRGGPDVAAATLSRAHALHVLLLPWLTFYLLLLNFWLLTRRWARQTQEAA